jgi:hypothetical protein
MNDADRIVAQRLEAEAAQGHGARKGERQRPHGVPEQPLLRLSAESGDGSTLAAAHLP